MYQSGRLLERELAFTECYQRNATEDKAVRESRCMETQISTYFVPPGEEDLIAGRISRIVTLDTLDTHDFEAILDSPASPIQKIENSHHVSISVDTQTRRKLAFEAEKSKMGCRYIRSKLENMLDEQMFDAPDTGRYELCCACP